MPAKNLDFNGTAAGGRNRVSPEAAARRFRALAVLIHRYKDMVEDRDCDGAALFLKKAGIPEKRAWERVASYALACGQSAAALECYRKAGLDEGEIFSRWHSRPKEHK